MGIHPPPFRLQEPLLLQPATLNLPELLRLEPPTTNLNVTAAPTGKSAANAPAGGNAPAPTALTPNSNLMERHRWANFAITGGFLGVRFTNTTYSALTLPVTAVTTTVTTTSVPTTPPTVTIGTPVVSSATYAFGTVNGPIQSTATAGENHVVPLRPRYLPDYQAG